MIWWASALEKYFTPKLSTHSAKVVLRVLCIHRPVVFGIVLYTWGAVALSSLLNSRTPDSFNPYIPLRISRYTKPSGAMLMSYSSHISFSILEGWTCMYW